MAVIGSHRLRTFTYFSWIESFADFCRISPLCADHDVPSRLVPEVVAELRSFVISRPGRLHVEVLSVEQQETSCKMSLVVILWLQRQTLVFVVSVPYG